MPIQHSRRLAVLGALVLATAGPARAQSWKEYAYPDAGFSAQFPARPTVAELQYRAKDVTAPARVYAAHQGSADYSVTVADLSASAVDKDAAIAEAARAFIGAGEVRLDVIERIDREFGRELIVIGKDGAHTATAIFYVNRKLYILAGRTDAERGPIGVRFQQSLQFVDAQGKPPRRPEDGPGPGGPAFGPPPGDGDPQGQGPDGRRRPPPQAFSDCRGKSEGAAVKHTTPRGDVVAATCVRTPDGLAARPNQPLDGG
jgi:hypothetical protein